MEHDTSEDQRPVSPIGLLKLEVAKESAAWFDEIIDLFENRGIKHREINFETVDLEVSRIGKWAKVRDPDDPTSEVDLTLDELAELVHGHADATDQAAPNTEPPLTSDTNTPALDTSPSNRFEH